MRIAIIADVHSNLAALEVVLSDAAQRQADELWCLGDIVGYGPEPRECLALVRERARLCLAGNHDLGAAGAIGLDEFNPYAAEANRWTGQVLTDEERAHLAALPAMLVHEEFTLAHGSPREPVWEYVLSSAGAAASFRHFETRYCLVGHSHVPFTCPEAEAGAPSPLYQAQEDVDVTLGRGRMIINPGSVGQPRDGDPRASYAIFDTARQAVHHHRVVYDVEATQRKMRAAGLPEYLADRLSRGH
jgi:diadenosine tetraphosphatase ApaH/serine/threonine PP2A family protein phosphatase